MMATQPTPEEASDALRQVSERRQQATSPSSQPKWVLGVAAALVLALGITSDLNPQLQTPMLYVMLAFVLVMTFLPRWKRFGSAAGYRRSPSVRPGMSSRTRVLNLFVMLAMMALVFGGSLLLRNSDVQYPGTIFSVVLVVAMPLLQRFFDYRTSESRGDHG